MATLRDRIYYALAPDASGNCWWEPASIADSNDLFPTNQVLRFKDTGTKITAGMRYTIQKNYVGTAKLVLRWKISATSGNVQLTGDYRAIADGESGDPTTFQESVNSGAVAVPGTTLLEKETSITLTSGNFAVDDVVEILIGRDGSSGNDTAAADLLLLMASFEYADV